MTRLLFIIIILLLADDSRAQHSLGRREAVADIEHYVQAMKASHFSPFAHITQAAFDARVREIESRMGDSIGLGDFLWTMYGITALLGDAHATPQLGQAAFRGDFQQPLFFPFRLVFGDDGVYAPREMAGQTGIAPGAPVLRINGLRLRDFRRELDTHLAGLPAFRQAAGARLLPYFL